MFNHVLRGKLIKKDTLKRDKLEEISEVKAYLAKVFDMKDLALNYFFY